MSDYVVHFTKSAVTMGAILGAGRLNASGPFGFSHYRAIRQVTEQHRSVCLSEIPLDQISQLTLRHGAYGIGFTKESIRSRHGARVWYLDEKSVQEVSLRSQMDNLVPVGNFDDALWDLTPFVDQVMPSRHYVFDWEREWRVRGNLDFDHSDVAIVVTPTGFDELPTLEGLYFHPEHEVVVAASSRPLEEYVEDLSQQFFQTFEKPDYLPVERGEHVWVVPEWETEAAIDDLFGDVEESIRAHLVDYLNSEGWSWVRSKELGHVYE